MDSILKKLADNGIFAITKLQDGDFKFEEQCDQWYYLNLSKEEMKQLIKELQDLIK